jgi:hypothetical protein
MAFLLLQKCSLYPGAPFPGAIPLDPAMRIAADEGRPFLIRIPGMARDNPTWKQVDAVMENTHIVRALEKGDAPGAHREEELLSVRERRVTRRCLVAAYAHAGATKTLSAGPYNTLPLACYNIYINIYTGQHLSAGYRSPHELQHHLSHRGGLQHHGLRLHRNPAPRWSATSATS